jgi:hypothetical protein
VELHALINWRGGAAPENRYLGGERCAFANVRGDRAGAAASRE